MEGVFLPCQPLLVAVVQSPLDRCTSGIRVSSMWCQSVVSLAGKVTTAATLQAD